MAQRRSLPAVCVLAGTRLAAGQAPADGQGAPRGPAWAPCWEKYTREECCGPDGGQRRASCFDSVFTARECCAGDGWARLSPEAEPTETAWEDAARWLQGGLLTEPPRGHPAYSRAQRRWEAGIANATVLLAEEVLGHRVQLRVFKRSGPALAKMLEEMREDLYRLRHAAPLPGESTTPVAVDVGAAVGATAVLLAKLWSGARVVAVEPTPANFRYLLWNLRLNGVAARVWPLNVAVGPEPSAAQVFYYSPTYPTWSQACGADCAPSAADDEWRGGWTDWQERFQAEVLTLAEVLAGLGLPGAVHLLKVDCEGCEWGIFAPLSWGRLRHRVRHVAAELHRWALPSSLSAADAGALEASVRGAVCAHEAEFENLLCSTM